MNTSSYEEEIPLTVGGSSRSRRKSTARITEVCPRMAKAAVRRRRSSSSSCSSSCSSSGSTGSIGSMASFLQEANITSGIADKREGGGGQLKRRRSSKKRLSNVLSTAAKRVQIEDTLTNLRTLQESARSQRRSLREDRDEARVAVDEVRNIRDELHRQLEAHYIYCSDDHLQ